MTRIPRVSVGVPVRNGVQYLQRTLDDLLGQTMEDLEVVVCDNGSTDGTPALLEEISRRDGRVRVHRNAVDLGPAANYDATLRQSRADLFCWSAADDRHDPDFLARTVAALDADRTAAVATVGVRRIGPDDEDLGRVEGEPDLSCSDVAERLRRLVFADQRRHGGHELFGVMRRDVLLRIGAQGPFAHSDRVTLVRLVLHGRFIRVDRDLFFNREHAGRSSLLRPVRAYGGRGWAVSALGSGPMPPDVWWDPSRANRVVWPEWRQLQEYQRAVQRAPLTPDERWRCRRVLAAFAVHQVPKLTRDVLIGVEFAARRAADRVPS